jgi:hypothetical protein
VRIVHVVRLLHVSTSPFFHAPRLFTLGVGQPDAETTGRNNSRNTPIVDPERAPDRPISASLMIGKCWPAPGTSHSGSTSAPHNSNLSRHLPLLREAIATRPADTLSSDRSN